jgi:4-methyl-5(b-hydroxyethyl)-thiazole monophosphate biosynthesis
MAKALVVLAPGFEEIEATTIIDVLRRAQIEVTVAALAEPVVPGSHGIKLVADTVLASVDASTFDGLVLPGGLPGAHHLRDDSRVIALVRDFVQRQKYVGAICAAPIVLEAAGVLAGRRATGYPGQALPSAEYVERSVVRDGKLVTSRGVGTALAFACELVACLASRRTADELASKMLVSV